MSDERRQLLADLAALDDERARWFLCDALAHRELVDAAVAALAAHGPAAVPYALAASHDPARRAAATAVLVRVATPAAIDRAGALAVDDDPVVRALAHAVLHRAGDRDAHAVARAIEREPSAAVLAVLAGRCAQIVPARAALEGLAAQAACAGPAELRAGCTWAIAVHELGLGAALAGVLVADPEAAFWLASVVARRGGPLGQWTDGLAADPGADRVADLLDLPGR